MVLKTVSSLMADLNVVSNPEFFMFFRTSSYIFGAKNISERSIFNWLSTSGFKTEAFNEKASFIKPGEKSFKISCNFILKNCEIFWCAETKLSIFL